MDEKVIIFAYIFSMFILAAECNSISTMSRAVSIFNESGLTDDTHDTDEILNAHTIGRAGHTTAKDKDDKFSM